jgi:hypothetical protein
MGFSKDMRFYSFKKLDSDGFFPKIYWPSKRDQQKPYIFGKNPSESIWIESRRFTKSWRKQLGGRTGLSANTIFTMVYKCPIIMYGLSIYHICLFMVYHHFPFRISVIW